MILLERATLTRALRNQDPTPPLVTNPAFAIEASLATIEEAKCKKFLQLFVIRSASKSIYNLFPPRYATRRYIICTPTDPLQRLDMDLGRIIRPQINVPAMTALCNVPARNTLIVDFGSHSPRHVASGRRR